jgi:GNAT superfamily N-acetyltransferase
MVLQPTDPRAAGFQAAIEEIWNAACGAALPIAPDLVEYNTRLTPGVVQASCLAVSDEHPVGFALASTVVDGLVVANGWVDAIAVLPDAQEQGIGSALLGWAEAWLATHGCGRARLGGSLRPFAAGLAVELETAAFSHRGGYVTTSDVWDVARRLSDYVTPNSVKAGAARIEPVQPGQEAALLSFLQRAFPGRWEWECREFLRAGGRADDVLALWDGGGVEGFCQVTFEDSARPLGRYYMQDLPRPWGQLGPIGIGQERRGKGYGAALLDAGLRYLRDRGVDGCVIDWTSLLDFYGKFGFQPYRQYAVLVKNLTADAPFS